MSLQTSLFKTIRTDGSRNYRDQLDRLPEGANPLEFGNSVYRITFEDRTRRPAFGHKYWFYLQDAVETVPEWVVQWEPFKELVHFFLLETG